MSKKIYLSILVISLLVNLFFLVFVFKYLLLQKKSRNIGFTFRKVFSNKTFDLVVENEKNAAEDFTIIARGKEGNESVFCVINNPQRVNLSLDSINNSKLIRSFAWEERFEEPKYHKFYYKLTRDNVQYLACSPDLTWTYKVYYESGRVRASCFYKGQWEHAKDFDTNRLTFHLESGIKLQWNWDKRDWEEQR